MSKTLRHMGPALAALMTALALSAPLGAYAQEKTLYTFSGGADGGTPNALVMGADGNIYGTAASGGAQNDGVVFELTPASGGGWTETVLHSFAGWSAGSAPNSLMFGPDGNIYGTAGGGNGACQTGCGTVFKLTPVSGSWQFNVIHTFQVGLGGHFPTGLIFDGGGNLYGTAFEGGTSNAGLIYELTPASDGTWTQSVVYNFTGGKDGTWPQRQLTLDAAGNVYGTTQIGGVAPDGFGTAFKLTAASGFQYSQIAYFIGSGASQPGAYPDFGLIPDGAGNLYGTTSGGDGDSGNVFRLKPSPLGGRWQLSVLHFFQGGLQGGTPYALALGSSGNLFGIALGGGSTSCKVGCGTIFSLQPETSGPWPFTLLYSFTGGNDGSAPNSLIIDAAGNLYGTAAGGSSGSGVAFELPAALK